MKRSKKIMLRVLPVLMILMVVLVGNLYAVTIPQGTASNTVSKFTGNIWATVSTVVQVLAVAAIVFAGVRYMFASADAKADIKQQTLILVIGAILVFAAVPIANMITNIGNQVVTK